MFVKDSKKKDTGTILLGFAVLMFGMETMSSAVEPLAEVDEFRNILLMFSNPIFGVLAGAVITGIIQSSSASVGILQALSATGQVTMGTAIPIIMGQNIGTCVTALLSSTGTTKNAKRAAFVHLYFNIVGTVVVMIAFYGLNAIFHFPIVNMQATELSIAIAHTSFNVICTCLLLPFSGLLEKLAYATVRGEDNEEDIEPLDERLLATPSIALEQCRLTVCDMALLSQEALENAIKTLDGYDEKTAAMVREAESRVDRYEDMLGSYIIQLAAKDMSEEDNNESMKLLHVIGDLERISDHAVNILEVAEEMRDKQITFSGKAKKELSVLCAAVREIVDMAVKVCEKESLELAADIEPLEEVIDAMHDKLRLRHTKRLQDGECTVELGFVYSDLLIDLERIADHCSNIGGCEIEMEEGLSDVHQYLKGVRDKNNEKFEDKCREYKQKYQLQSL